MSLDKRKIVFKGYSKQLLDYIFDNQFLNEDIYKLFVNQYRIHPDIENGWRGEFWGKLTRSACSVYKLTQSKELYNVLKDSVLDILTVQEPNGRVSSYPLEKEFQSWDLWGRKYVMLGLIYFYDICKSEALKRKIIKFLKKHANYIIKRIGDGKNQKSIFETSPVYGTLNSCSILSPFVRLYNLTNEQKYLDFAKYLVDSGLCKTFNIIDAAFDSNLSPFEFNEKKAYELMSCYNGLLDYYEVTKEKTYLNAVESFVDKLLKTDYTVIGCAGTDSEFLDNSSLKQTEETKAFSQETCVTVTLMDLCKHLYDLTGSTKYIDVIERSTLNAYFGAINNEEQTMKDSRGLVWHGDDCYCAKHPSFPFDSYSPLVNYKRGYQVAGFMLMQNGESYGCCAAIGGFGMGIYLDSLIDVKDNQVTINLFDSYSSSFIVNGNNVSLVMKANPFNSNKYLIKVKGGNTQFTLKVRIPSWMKNASLSVDGTPQSKIDNNYFVIENTWNNNEITISFDKELSVMDLNNKVSLNYGPIVLTSDERLNKDNNVVLKKNKASTIKVKKNKAFNSNVCLSLRNGKHTYYFVDYAQAGKNFDEEQSNISVWFNTK